ncbi:MAG: MBL fold metallo-hydrolase [Deltaproteobacteria bacterium]|nr:MBL fold metallo-hydrolase [Deltaproteobacteria bacterium]
MRRRYRQDNYLYLLAEGEDAALVDPGDPGKALALCREAGVRPRAIVHTHGHADHSGGSDEVKAALGVPVLGHGADAGWYRPDEDLAGRGQLALGALRIRLHHVPGHTPGSLLLQWGGALLTGDTLFWGGCGNCRHGGDPAALARSFLGTIAALDGALQVHPGHDYAAQNLPFALALEPGNEAARRRLEEVQAARAAGSEPPASTLAGERAANPFLRVEALGEALASRGLVTAGPEAAFVALRALRDRS